MNKRVGLLGGVFDPVHNGHIQLAQMAMDRVNLDEVIFVPTADPPHKAQPTVAFHERAYMVELATKGLEGLGVSLIEGSLKVPSYTIDTLKHFLNNTLEDDIELYFILGLDAFLDIESWHLFQRVLELTNLIVVVRVGYDIVSFEVLAKKLGYIKKNSVDWYHTGGTTSLHFVFEPPFEISSTEVREITLKDGAYDGLIPKQVADYIKEKKFYSVH